MAYTSAVTTSPIGSGAERISRNLGIFAGKCNVTDYDSGTLLEITGITRNFIASTVSGYTHGIIAVIPQGLSDEGLEFKWDYTTGAFNAYYPTSLSIPVTSGTAYGALSMVTAGGSITAAGKLAAVSAVGTLTAEVVAAEATALTDVGEISFIAIGFIRG